ncbi:Protein of unknown function [Bacillus wiedmannii]|nr:Protein of unknown function [Bacillus wiedmannii]
MRNLNTSFQLHHHT